MAVFVWGWVLLASAGAISIYPYEFSPELHPEALRHHVKPLPKAILGQTPRFVASRGLGVDPTTLTIQNINQSLDDLIHKYNLGDIVWPTYAMYYAKNADDYWKALALRNMLVTDVWDYVPGDLMRDCQASGEVCEFILSNDQQVAIEGILGAAFTGMDVGEQDGRYAGSYANQIARRDASRQQQYVYFWRHFDRMSGDLKDKLSALTSVYYPHYLVKSGTYTTVSSETAQALPNAQLFMAFNRGASKQYGIWWWSNVSVYNRWGYKGYPSDATSGTSLSLMRRLMYSQIMYNCIYVSFESAWLNGTDLSPVGQIQSSARSWVAARNFTLGRHLTPIAVMLDFYAGWLPPRYLYTDGAASYQTWGNLPYSQGDHLTHAVLNQLYPGYADSSYFHNEKGFQAPTPFSDGTDVLLSDAPLFVLQQYAVLVLGGEVAIPASSQYELACKLEQYVATGGSLVLTSRTLANFPAGIFNVTATMTSCTALATGTTVTISWPTSSTVTEPAAVQVCEPNFARSSVSPEPVALAGTTALAWRMEHPSGGSLLLLGALDGITTTPSVPLPVKLAEDAPCPVVYPLAQHVEHLLASTYTEMATFIAVGNDNLTYSVNYNNVSQTYLVAVFNPTWTQQPFQLTSSLGAVDVVEIALPNDHANVSIGYTPPSVNPNSLGSNTASAIAGGSARLFELRLQSAPSLHPSVPDAPPVRGVALWPLPGVVPTFHNALNRPTFSEHYDTMVIDAQDVLAMSSTQLAAERRYYTLQNVRVVIDATSIINLYPDVRLTGVGLPEHNTSMAMLRTLLTMAAALNSSDVLISWHRCPENYYTALQCETDLKQSTVTLLQWAAQLNITLHMSNRYSKTAYSPIDANAFVESLLTASKTSNLKLAVTTSLFDLPALVDDVQQLGFVWLTCPEADPVSGYTWNPQGSVLHCSHDQLVSIQTIVQHALARGVTIIPAHHPKDESEEMQVLQMVNLTAW